jgi:signal transduction histidine kinase
MDQESQKSFIKKFTQIEPSTTRTSSRRGLGLSIAKTIADRMDALLSVESTVGMGSVFHLDLPTSAP